MSDFPIDSETPNNSKVLWENWEKSMSRLVGPCYRFVTIQINGQRLGYFINVPMTLYTLKAHYEEFAKLNGGAFIPEKVINEINLENSHFWTQVFASSLGSGLLLGYGDRNAFLFDFRPQLPRFADFEKQIQTQIKKRVKVSDLSLPSFCVFCLGDEKMEIYKRQREEIIKAFKGRDFEKTVKQWLAIGCRDEMELHNIEH